MRNTVLLVPLTGLITILLLSGCSTSNAEHKAPVPEDAVADLLFCRRIDQKAGIFRQSIGVVANEPRLLIEAGNWPEPSPDGSMLLYQARSKNGDLDIWLAAIDGSNRRPLTDDPAHDYLASWSPDGRWITFTSWRTESSNGEPSPHLYMMRSDGSGPQRILHESLGTSAGADWSPDGRSIVFSQRTTDGLGRICVAAIDPSADRPIGEVVELLSDERSNGTPVFSPDGERIAFYSSTETESQIVVIDRDGSNRRVIVGEGFNWYPSWSPDGTSICFTRAVSEDQQDLDLFVVSIESDAPPQPVVVLPGRQAEGRFVR